MGYKKSTSKYKSGRARKSRSVEVKMTSSTGGLQLETGDQYVYSVDQKGNTQLAVNVANILGMGSWNVILVIENGKYVKRKTLKQNLSRSDAFAFAKDYVKKNG